MDASGQALGVQYVVDGQQRLTTLVVLLDQLRRQLEAQGRAELAAGIGTGFIRTKDIGGEDPPKLRLNEDLRDLFERRVPGSGGGAITLGSEQRLVASETTSRSTSRNNGQRGESGTPRGSSGSTRSCHSG